MATNPRGPWTDEERRREERAQEQRARRDAARGLTANLRDPVDETKFARRFADAFAHTRSK